MLTLLSKFDCAAEIAADQPAEVPLLTKVEGILVERPVVLQSVQSERAPYLVTQSPIHIDAFDIRDTAPLSRPVGHPLP